MVQVRSANSQRLFSLSSALMVSACLVSVLQGIFFALEDSWGVYKIVAMGLAAATVCLAWQYVQTDASRYRILVFFCFYAQFVLFSVPFAGAEPPLSFRLLQVAILESYLAAVLTLLLARIKILPVRLAFLVSYALAVSYFFLELLFSLSSFGASPGRPAPMTAHPSLDIIHHVPYSVIAITDLGKEPTSSQQNMKPWQLYVRTDNAATLEYSSTEPARMRVAIKQTTRIPWHIQLYQEPLVIKAQQRYAMSFRARADQPRPFTVGVMQAHDPWQSLGLVKQLELTTIWQQFFLEFTAEADDDARMFFSMGESDISVDVSDVRLLDILYAESMQRPASPMHSILTPAPYAVFNTYLPHNLRRYFQEDTKPWHLQVQAGNAATLEASPTSPETMRVTIQQATKEHDWHIGLQHSPLSVTASHRYALMFWARSEQPRLLTVSVNQAHAPWQSLGLRRKIETTPEWQRYFFEFIATEDDDNARVYFALADSEISVDLSQVTLRDMSEGRTVRTNLTKPYYVQYRLNNLGCRGRNYPLKRAEDTVRILLLGDAYALGIGVHEEDTFASRLEHSFNTHAETRHTRRSYEVINCGVSGYSTRDERLFYQHVASQYEPDLVLLVMGWNDNRPAHRPFSESDVHSPLSKLAHLFSAWSRLQHLWSTPPAHDPSASLQEVLQLHNAVQEHRARFAVVIFRNVSASTDAEKYGLYWTRLVQTLTQGLQDSSIPVLDLGTVLFANHSERSLYVYDGLDHHPNDIAHRIAAKEILQFLQQLDMAILASP